MITWTLLLMWCKGLWCTRHRVSRSQHDRMSHTLHKQACHLQMSFGLALQQCLYGPYM